jgi:DNA-directed RNA polymerase subunit RPC12/RpoP
MDKTIKSLIKYKCLFCQKEFSKYVKKSYGEVNPLTQQYYKKKIISDQVKCPYCLNFNPTW